MGKRDLWEKIMNVFGYAYVLFILFSLRAWGLKPLFGWWKESRKFFIIRIEVLLCCGSPQIIL